MSSISGTFASIRGQVAVDPPPIVSISPLVGIIAAIAGRINRNIRMLRCGFNFSVAGGVLVLNTIKKLVAI